MATDSISLPFWADPSDSYRQGEHSMSMTAAEANIELAILDSKAQDLDRTDFLTRFINKDLPQEVVMRLQELWDAREEIAGRVVHVGRIALSEINKFVDANPNLAIGVALGAAVGVLTSMIPFIGPILAPLAAALSLVVFIISGKRLDDDQKTRGGLIGIGQDVILLARKFFELLASIFNALRTQPARA
jgi:ElaB/YqjD/DUF883 family membrane-anchored ribosome-binding protein